MNTDTLLAEIAATDRVALAAAADAAEEALACHRDALAALAEGWRSETGSTATELLHRRCAEATDIVAALRRAAEDLTLLNDGWADPPIGETAEALRAEGLPTAEHPITEASTMPVVTPVSGNVGAVPASPPDPPAAVPSDAVAAPPWAAQAAGGPWPAAPTTAPQAPPNVLLGGSVPAPSELGGALAGLVAQIAQMLGSYADIHGADPVEGPAETPLPPAKVEPRPPAADSHPPEKASAAPSSLPDSALPKSGLPQSAPPAQTQAPLPELLAAERAPDPGAPGEPTPPPVSAAAPPVSAAAPPVSAAAPPVSAGGAQTPPPPPVSVVPSPTAAAETKTPCEIAADDLAKVGE